MTSVKTISIAITIYTVFDSVSIGNVLSKMSLFARSQTLSFQPFGSTFLFTAEKEAERKAGENVVTSVKTICSKRRAFTTDCFH